MAAMMRLPTPAGCSTAMYKTFAKMENEIMHNSSASIDHMNEMPFFKRALEWY